MASSLELEIGIGVSRGGDRGSLGGSLGVGHIWWYCHSVGGGVTEEAGVLGGLRGRSGGKDFC